MTIDKSISLILLCYNDGESLPKIVDEAMKVLSTYRDFEIIITDDGSAVETIETINKLQKDNNSVKVIAHKSNKGVGANFRNGLSLASKEVVIYMDGDGQYSPKDIPTLLNCLTPQNMVSGLRIIRNDTAKRIIVSKLYNSLINIIHRIKCKDTNSGFKAYNAYFLKSLQLKSNGPFFDAEIIIAHKRCGYSILEIPINHYTRKFGKAGGIRFKNVYTTFSEALRYNKSTSK